MMVKNPAGALSLYLERGEIRCVDQHSSFAVPLLATLPHSGERIPAEFQYLASLPKEIQLADVDRFVDELYESALISLGIPFVVTPWHRYVCDLNRTPDEVDQNSVEGAPHPPGTHSHGFLWVKTMSGEPLLERPLTQAEFNSLRLRFFDPFHAKVQSLYEAFRKKGFRDILHLDLHSMPSVGTTEHRDPGERRAEVVISDFKGASAKTEYMELVCNAFLAAGFKLHRNWPYFGGKITQTYGKPHLGQHTLQIEINRSLYMDEKTKEKKRESFDGLKAQLKLALSAVVRGLS
jgi:N-formylglutamate amidohydrolase